MARTANLLRKPPRTNSPEDRAKWVEKEKRYIAEYWRELSPATRANWEAYAEQVKAGAEPPSSSYDIIVEPALEQMARQEEARAFFNKLAERDGAAETRFLLGAILSQSYEAEKLPNPLGPKRKRGRQTGSVEYPELLGAVRSAIEFHRTIDSGMFKSNRAIADWIVDVQMKKGLVDGPRSRTRESRVEAVRQIMKRNRLSVNRQSDWDI